MAALLDVNVLVALAWPNHVHHAPAHAWFARRSTDGWATCAITETGFIRVSSNQRAIPDAVSPLEAAEVLRAMIAREGTLSGQMTFGYSTSRRPRLRA